MVNKKRMVSFGIVVFLSLFLITFVVADTCSLEVTLVNQDPYPAIPGDYVEVVFQVSGVENPGCDGVMFKLIPSYPFSLDGEDAARVLEGSTYISNYKTDWIIPYRLRIDDAALEGYPEIKVEYGMGTTIFSQYFNISIQDSRTTFDAVVQEVEGAEVSIALANTGKYGADSIIVRIPEQSNFKVVDNNGQMVGNLDSGDYTLVSFNLMAMPQDGDNTLVFDIHYTDAIGERRIVSLNMPLRMLVGASTTGEIVPGSKRGNGTPIETPIDSGINWILWISLFIVLTILLIIYKKYSKQINEIYQNFISGKKKSLKKSSDGTPDWMKMPITKEKRK